MARPPLFDQLRATAPHLSVGMATANWLSLGSELKLLEDAGATLLHFDVMDGVFCPMLTFGPSVVSGCKTNLLKDVHLMIEDPLDKLPSYVAAGADLVTVHVESTRHIHRAFQVLSGLTNATDPARGILRGIGLCPGTPVEAVEPLLEQTDMVVLLAVNPGWGGQPFDPGAASRLARLRQILKNAGRDALVCVDGGITRKNIADVMKLGPDIVVAGSAVFDGKNAAANAAEMLKAVRGRS